jgi:hypothetical protein
MNASFLRIVSVSACALLMLLAAPPPAESADEDSAASQFDYDDGANIESERTVDAVLTPTSSWDHALVQPPEPPLGLPSNPAPYSPQAIEDPTAPPPAALAAPPAAAKKPAAPPAPYKGVFYDNDFSYLTKPDNKYCYLGDCLKRNACGDCWLIDLGGEYRARHHHEVNLRGSNLSGLDDDFLLHRTRLYANVEYSNWFRFYGEAIDATSEFEDFTPRTIEENRFDALNLFVDGLISDYGGGELWGRVGRQELLYGDQRLISPLDWSNTRRTFDGAKVFYRSTAWDVDGFWTRPVPFSQHVNHDSNFDHPDQSQEFMGLYATYKGRKDYIYDFYFLRLAEYDGPGTALSPVDFDANTFGTRWKGKHCCWLWEIEGGYQFGDFGTRDQSAGFVTGGLGREWAQARWKPTLWAYYDWASGDRDPADGDHGTFNQLFPLGHKYLGYADLVARQNINDVNFIWTASPTQKIKLLAWYHIFFLDEPRDALYNSAGAPIRVDPTGAAGRDVGQELDLTVQYIFSPRADVLVGYSHFWAGDFVSATNPPGVTGDVDFTYTQFSWRF